MPLSHWHQWTSAELRSSVWRTVESQVSYTSNWRETSKEKSTLGLELLQLTILCVHRSPFQWSSIHTSKNISLLLLRQPICAAFPALHSLKPALSATIYPSCVGLCQSSCCDAHCMLIWNRSNKPVPQATAAIIISHTGEGKKFWLSALMQPRYRFSTKRHYGNTLYWTTIVFPCASALLLQNPVGACCLACVNRL